MTYNKTNSPRLYGVWFDMRRRCKSPSHHAYEHYGARGISVCEEWSSFNAFAEWAYSNGYDNNAPKGKCTIDRIDNDSGYSPENCRWVDMKVQGNNKRTNVSITYNGETLNLSEWADKVGVNVRTLISRIYRDGWSIEKALTTPIKEKEKPKYKPCARLSEYLKNIGMTKKELAEKIGVSQYNLYSVINGRLPLFPKYKRLILKELSVSSKLVFDEEGDE